MEIDKVYEDDSDALIPTERLPPSSASLFLDSFWISKSSPSFQGDSASGSTNMANFQNCPPENAGLGGLIPPMEKEESGNEDYDPSFQQPEKKRRLTIDQVKFLEKSFEVENKLDPERKFQLAKDLGLQPRQVAIWFQNRRARFKNKQLEKDYDSLKQSYDKLKVDYDSLSKSNEKLRLEVKSLKRKAPIVEKRLELHNTTSSVDPEPAQTPYSSPVSQLVSANVMTIKQEDANSAKSDVFDSESPHCNHVSLFEPVDSSRVLEQDLSDFSQDEDDESCRILPASCLPKLKIESYNDLTADTCNLGTCVDEQTFWFWS
ncbi:Homeobox-leucine zipper protein HAT5 [Heracleum sosnowskyi]|uniref:Homeobox-leucine zipper protein n=1 Tax=Heracleum sosnowskyi TaxID=360622 RepID=A0AAD8HZT4_9APIA|nr:Homeobox-leucine zipper protein HAT5 [Heracleum sosnowskyi]